MKNRPLDLLTVWCFALLVLAPWAYTLWNGNWPPPQFAPVDDERMADWINLGPQDPGSLNKLDQPVSLTLDELDGALYAYTQFFLIAHETWAASESTEVWSRIALTGLPEDEDTDAQLDRFPKLREHMWWTPRWLVLLDGPQDRFPGGGVLSNPGDGRLTLAHRSLAQQGYGQLASHLEQAESCNLQASLLFTPVGRDRSADLDRFTLSLAGQLRDGNVVIDAVSSPVSNPQNLRQLVDAASAIDEYRNQSPSNRLSLIDAEQAATVVQLASRLMIEAKQEDADVVCASGHEDLASVAAYVRFGNWMPASTQNELQP